MPEEVKWVCTTYNGERIYVEAKWEDEARAKAGQIAAKMGQTVQFCTPYDEFEQSQEARRWE